MHGHKIVTQNHIHFITPTVVGWADIFTRKIYKDIIIDRLKYGIEKKGLNGHAYVIMSNHLHLVISAREGYNLSNIIRDFKRHTAKIILEEIISNSKESRQEWMLRLLKYFTKNNTNNKLYQLWKRDNHLVELVSNIWIGRRIKYIHQNPVRSGVVDAEEQYVYSSARGYKGAKGLVPIEILETHL